MKKLFLLSLLAISVSCNEVVDIQYYGGVIIGKSSTYGDYKEVCIRMVDSTFKTVIVSNSFYNGFDVGDTIK